MRIPNQILLVRRNDGQIITCYFVIQPIEQRIFRKRTRFPAAMAQCILRIVVQQIPTLNFRGNHTMYA